MIPKNENDLIVVDLEMTGHAGENGPDSGNSVLDQEFP